MRVFNVCPGSPSHEAGLEVCFDIIQEMNGIVMDTNYLKPFTETIQGGEDGIVKMKVYNLRSQSSREVVVKPRKWAGTGLLGATVRYDAVDPTESQGIRVLEIFPNSPAAHAGLMPFQDFLMGSSKVMFSSIDDLVEIVTAGLGQRVHVYVYNTDTEAVREVWLTPNYDWGGDGCIGCDIGSGLLHRIPAPRRPPGAVVFSGQPHVFPAAATFLPVSTAPTPAPVASPIASALSTIEGAPPLTAVAAPASVPSTISAAAPTNATLTQAAAQSPPSAAQAQAAPAAAPQAPAALASSQVPVPAATTTSEAMAQLQAQISQLGKATAAPQVKAPGGVTWPPPAPQHEQTGDASANSTEGLYPAVAAPVL